MAARCASEYEAIAAVAGTRNGPAPSFSASTATAQFSACDAIARNAVEQHAKCASDTPSNAGNTCGAMSANSNAGNTCGAMSAKSIAVTAPERGREGHFRAITRHGADTPR